MLNMLKLNWSAMKCYRIQFLIIPVALLVVGCISSICIIPMGVFLLFSFSLNPFAVEEKGDLNRLYLTLPVKRREVVTGRYVLSFLLFLLGILLGYALMPLTNLISLSKWYLDFYWSTVLISFSFLFYSLMNLAMYPLLFKLGYQKGKIWGYYLPAGLICLIYIGILEYDAFITGGMLLFNLLVYASKHILAVSSGLIGLGIVLLAVSYVLSVRIYSRREF